LTESAAGATSDGFEFASHGSICEICSLVIMLVSFLAAGVLCIRRFFQGSKNLVSLAKFYKRSTEVISEAGRKNDKVRLQITVTVTTVFVTFLMRCVYAVALAVSRRGRIRTPWKTDPECPPSSSIFCDSCQEVGLIVQSWLWLCPAFSFTVFLLSSPVTILVSLWGMTTESMLNNMK
jgi:hypothetical protein